jgi:transposase
VKPLEGKELKKLQAEISTSIRQKITPDFLKQVAEIYLDALKRGLDPNPEIMAKFKCAKRTAQEWTQKARELGYPLPATVGRIPKNKPTKRKEK